MCEHNCGRCLFYVDPNNDPRGASEFRKKTGRGRCRLRVTDYLIKSDSVLPCFSFKDKDGHTWRD